MPVPLNRFTLYVAHCNCFGELVPDIERWIDEAAYTLTTIAEGATCIPAIGMHYNKEEGQLIKEPTSLVYANVDHAVFMAHWHLVEDFIKRYGGETMQQCVMYEYQNQVHFVSDYSASVVTSGAVA